MDQLNQAGLTRVGLDHDPWHGFGPSNPNHEKFRWWSGAEQVQWHNGYAFVFQGAWKVNDKSLDGDQGQA